MIKFLKSILVRKKIDPRLFEISKYRFSVYREENRVFYEIKRSSLLLHDKPEHIVKNEVQWHELNVFVSIFLCTEGSEKCVEYLLKSANKLARKAIDNLNKYER